MEVKFKKSGLFIYFFVFEASSQLFLIKPSVHEFYVTEIVRVKRQAGYVYDRPSTPFNLPSRPSIAPTETMNVDRTQEPHMYYAYPVPSGGNAAKPGQSSNTSSKTASGSGSGYNYGTSVNLGTTQATSMSGTTTNGGSASSSQTGSGYNYNSPNASVGSGQTSKTTSSSTATSSVSVGYGYGAPSSSNSGQIDTSTSSQGTNEGATQASPDQTNGMSAGYGYNTPSVSSVQSSRQTNYGYSLAVINSINSGYGYEAPASSSEEETTNYKDHKANANLQEADRSSSVLSNTNSLLSGYSYDTSLNGDQSMKTSSSSTATSSVSTTYNYNPPVDNSLGSVDTSTSAPQYLPPIAGANSGVVASANDGNFKNNGGNNDGSSESNVGYDERNNVNFKVGTGGGTTDYRTGDSSRNTNNEDATYSTGIIGYAPNTDGNNGLTINSDVSRNGNEASTFGGYTTTRGANEPGGVTGSLSGSVSGFSAGGAGLNTAVTAILTPSRPSNTYIPNSSISNNQPIPPSQTYIASDKDFMDSSSPSSGSVISPPVSKPSITYIPSSSISKIPSSIISSSKPSNVPIRNYIEPLNSLTRPSAPLQTYTPSSKSSSFNIPGQSYVPSRSESTGPIASQPSATFIPQNIKSLGSVTRPLSKTYVPQIRSSPGPPSPTYVPQFSEAARPTLDTPSLNYIPPRSRPTIISQSNDHISPLSNKNYLPPNEQPAPSVPVSNSGPLQPFGNYLPPLANSLPIQQSLASTYLPPVV